MWILLLKICLLTTLFYSLYHWALRGNTFFRFNRVYLLAGMFIALALPFIPLYYAVPTVSETDLPETAFRIGNIISIEMKVNESVNFSQIGCLIYISGLIVLLLGNTSLSISIMGLEGVRTICPSCLQTSPRMAAGPLLSLSVLFS